MPSGYTSNVANGKVTELNDYLLNCAKAFGALVNMRDMPDDTPIPLEILPDTYHEKELVFYKKSLDDLVTMNQSKKIIECAKYNKDGLADAKESNEERAKIKLNYEIMLYKVRKWKDSHLKISGQIPIKEGYDEFFKFIEKQLIDSLEWDTEYPESVFTPLSVDEWYYEEMDSILRNIKYHDKALKEEIVHTKEKNDWLQGLRKMMEN